MSTNQKGFTHLLIPVIIVLLVGVIGFAGWRVLKSHRSSQAATQTSSQSSFTSTSNSGGNPMLSSLPACSNATLLDHAPVDSAAFTGIEPLGHLNGEHVLPSQGDHAYFDLQPASATTSQVTKVYAPGNVTLVQLTQTKFVNNGHVDYGLYFAPCRDLVFEYGHIENLSAQILSALANAKPMCQNSSMVDNCMYQNLSIKLTSGEQVGTAGGPTFSGNAFDFGATDDRVKPLAFIDTSRPVLTGSIEYGENNSYKNAVCPIDYFTPSMKSSLYGKLLIKDANANGVPACGTSMQDLSGTSQGDWYSQAAKNGNGQGLDIAGSLALAHYNMDPTLGEVSVGSDLVPSQWGGTQLIFTPKSSGYINRDPSQIKPDGHVYCFDGTEGAMLSSQGSEIHFDVALSNGTTLAVDYGSGACAANPTLSSPKTYTR